ncbi:ras-related protein Rab-30-like isoform X2 [Tachypleus tridentatus]|uniref:ras-related protein Rab-30-like isoform X2 n=1 Tax=Tachypleus tridentatus TaxID=6853 RepID=UPI003FD30351
MCFRFVPSCPIIFGISTKKLKDFLYPISFPVMEDYKFLFKVVLIGNAGVGKTCIVRRFTQGLFPPGQGATIGVDFLIKTVQVDGEKVKLQIWDTAGQERFRSITQSYYRSAHALILVYEISSHLTFDCLHRWLKEIEQFANPKVLRILVGNKTDRKDREVPNQIGEEFAKAHNMYFIETSAKDSDNVEKLFLEIAAQLTREAKATRAQFNNSELIQSFGKEREKTEHHCYHADNVIQYFRYLFFHILCSVL